MNRLRDIIVFLYAVACLCAPAWGEDAAPKIARISGTVVGVVDGDTVDASIPMSIWVTDEHGKWVSSTGSRIVRIRLLADSNGRGCWAPESRTKDPKEKLKGLASKGHLLTIAMGKKCVVVVPLKSDRLIDYMSLERLLTVVEVGGKSLGELQIKAEYASSTKGGKLGQ